jgi:2'-5' RNA ligase
MDCDGNGAAGTQRLNEFALVIYVPGVLARFLDELRLELVADCSPRAHMTVLPPRPLDAVPAAIGHGRAKAADFAPFEIEATEIEVFPRTNVIYIGVGRGSSELRNLHKALNTGPLAFDEPFDYCPHITLAQDFDPAQAPRLESRVAELWKAYTGPRVFQAEALTFVQNTAGKSWIDLATLELGTAVRTR